MPALDMTDLVTAMRKVDAMHEPSEANALLTAGAQEIERLRSLVRMLPGGHWHPGDDA